MAMDWWHAQQQAQQPVQQQTPAQPEQASQSWIQSLISARKQAGNIVGAVGEPLAQMATGMIAKPVSEIAGLAAIGAEMVSPQGGDPEAFKRSVAEQLTYQPKTEWGASEYNPITAAMSAVGGVVGKGGELVRERTKAVTGSDIAAAGTEEAAMQALGFLGVKGAPKVGASIAELNRAKLAVLKEHQANDAIRNSIRKEGKKLNLIAPAEGATKRTLSGLGGAEPVISMKNTATGTNVLAKDVGLGKGAISDADIAARVIELNKKYENVGKALGSTVPIKLSFKGEVSKLLNPLKKEFAQDPRAFSANAEAIALLEQQLKPIVDARGKLVKQNIETPIVMEKIRQLRSDARKLDSNVNGDPSKSKLAKTNYELANLYENLIEQSLGNRKVVIDEFRNARKQLAKIHMLEASRLPTGMIDLQKFGNVVGKYSADKAHVTESFKTVSDFANTFKQVSRPITESELARMSRAEMLSALIGTAAAPATSGFSLLAATPMMARGVVPFMAERGMLQGKAPSYNLSTIRRAAPTTVQAGMLGTGLAIPSLKEEQ